ncbi:hydantoinase/oxoprolinase family protein [Bradyrhizobium sp. Arg237L]|uniref:hydantoinase/oxoprolinase family protein n=1 Tax=Bradyrhizobium sp. Arg237L TaxID=3003352 RepID=UPI00249F5ABA|nr:hydantoinase/oxoprolinase family protein [Bradyrhizobium sp. Arg237L]MDI4231890.1 hydantoinase/oxoprolinase family protein [Bradyrhizobium sp. Arg237L]
MTEPNTPARGYRIGIDVGGTFTKAVLIDNATHEVVGRFSVLTTHSDPRGVAKGVVEVFHNVLEQSSVDPREVIFLAHSTTQATNALLEGDVASVGVIGMSTRVESLLAKGQSAMKPIELAPGRYLTPANRFLMKETLSDETVDKAIDELKAEGVKVVVASSAFGVDDNEAEETVRRLAVRAGLAATCGNEITKLYGLTTRTRTAVINASILPKMIDTASMTEASVREAGILAPLMIMRGDGGVMDIKEMRRRPVMTMLSGPAASVAGALMYLRVSDGIYFEVGGTSTNIGVIRNGRPTVKYARVGGHETYVSSLDVRVIGIAGGSMVRARDGKLVDVGPRSAHIAGLPYAAFAAPEDIIDPKIEFFQPKADDPADYVALRSATGTCYAITNTCAANILGYAKPGLHASGNTESARRAMAALAAFIGKPIEDTARAILDIATDKIIPVVDDLITEYKLDRDQALLVGEGGGAAALIPHTSVRTGLHHEISRDAEVISSIGVALALVRDVVERIIPNAKPGDIKRIRREAVEAVVKLGAAPEGVEVTIEVDPNTHRVRATAMGASEMRARQRKEEVGETEAREIAAKAMGVGPEHVALAAATPRIRVFQGAVEERSWGIFKKRRNPVRAIDLDGVIRVQRSHSVVRRVTARTALDGLRRLWEDTTIYNGDSTITPDIFVIVGGQLIDLSGVNSIDQAMAVTRGELDGLTADASIALIGVPPSRGL